MLHRNRINALVYAGPEYPAGIIYFLSPINDLHPLRCDGFTISFI